MLEMPVLTPDEALWERLFRETQGAMALCYQCGVCTATCPWGLVRHEPFSVRAMMRRAQVGLLDGDDHLWLCAACAQCEALCPRGVPVSEIFQAMRERAWETRHLPRGLSAMLWSVYWNNNPWFQPPSYRVRWARDLEVPRFDPAQHELLYYVGCTSAYDRRAQKVARALVQLLRAAGVRFGTLGNDEPCCGEAVKSLGHRPYFYEIAQNNAKIFADAGVRELITTSPHCYDVFQNHYPRFQAEFRPYHYTQYLARLLEEGRLRFAQEVRLRVTYHDPCYLGRRNGEYDAPRRILDAIPGLERVEMAHSGPEALCCGGGGGRMWLETRAGERFADLRVQEALQTGAQVIATACPFCMACLEDSLKGLGVQGIRVMDVAEIAAMAISPSGTDLRI